MMRALVTVIVGAVVAGAVIGLLPGISADDGWAVLTVAIVLGVLGAILMSIGLSAPLARWAIEAGNLPTIGRWRS